MASTILAMAAVTFAVRLVGMLLPTAHVPRFWRRFLAHVPVAVFAALIVSGLPGSDAPDSAWRVASAAVTGLLVWRTRSLALGLLGGLTLYLVVRASTG